MSISQFLKKKYNKKRRERVKRSSQMRTFKISIIRHLSLSLIDWLIFFYKLKFKYIVISQSIYCPRSNEVIYTFVALRVRPMGIHLKVTIVQSRCWGED